MAAFLFKFFSLFELSHRRKWMIIVSLLTSGTITLLSVAVPKIFRSIVDDIINHSPFENIVRYGLLFVGIAIIRASLSIFLSKHNGKFSKELTTELRTKALSRVLCGRLCNIESTTVGKTVSIIMSDTSDVCALLCNTCIPCVLDLIMIVGLLFAMFLCNWLLALLTLTTVPFLAWGSFIFRKRLNILVAEQRSINHTIASKLNERIRSIRLVKSGAKERDEIKIFSAAFLESNAIGIKETQIKAIISSTNEVINKVSSIALFAFGGWLVIEHKMTFGRLVEYIAYASMLQDSLLRIINIPLAFYDARPAIACLYAYFYSREILEPNDGDPLPCGDGCVEFRDVRFSYPVPENRNLNNYLIPEKIMERPVLANVNFRLDPGKMHAFMGVNGSGKSTIAALISRFYDPTEGVILLDGHDVKKHSLDSFRRQLGMAEQNAHLFKGSIRENLTYLCEEASADEIEYTCKLVGLDKIVALLPNGLDYMIGEIGISLSEGQRQRIGLARALIRKPRLIVLDEALSSIDEESEIAILNNLKVLRFKPTIVVISHSRSAIRICDRIFEVKDGRIVEARMEAKSKVYEHA